MDRKIKVRPLGWIARAADFAMIPLMQIGSGTLWEEPQRTHRWNNTKLSQETVGRLSVFKMVDCEGVPGNIPGGGSRFHIPILGGWREYIVLEPAKNKGVPWHVGWIAKHAIGVSRIPLIGPVRVLRGDDISMFFGISVDANEQIQIGHVGAGRIGKGGRFSQIPLL